ncbi:MAG: hypothetical protein HFF36_04335 [Coprobacillus sp.]|nr:hypothetical protein [Coprobacillus sp.]
MLKTILFVLELGMRVICSFVLGLFIGLQLDEYFGTKPILLLICLLFSFIYIMKLLLGVGKNE